MPGFEPGRVGITHHWGQCVVWAPCVSHSIITLFPDAQCVCHREYLGTSQDTWPDTLSNGPTWQTFSLLIVPVSWLHLVVCWARQEFILALDYSVYEVVGLLNLLNAVW